MLITSVLLNIVLFTLEVFTWLVLVNVVASWLLAFGVLNYSNPIVYKIMNTVYRITEPVMSPVRSAMPSLGGIDLSPIVVLFAIQGLRQGAIWLFLQIA